MGEYRGSGTGDERRTAVGISTESMDDALNAAANEAVKRGIAEVGSRLTVLRLQIVISNPQVGEYHAEVGDI
jgi:hypothetical protein